MHVSGFALAKSLHKMHTPCHFLHLLHIIAILYPVKKSLTPWIFSRGRTAGIRRLSSADLVLCDDPEFIIQILCEVSDLEGRVLEDRPRGAHPALGIGAALLDMVAKDRTATCVAGWRPGQGH